LLGERGNYFTWDYIENGPDWWRVRIAKPVAITPDTVGKIAAKDFRKADVFKKLGIDFCCGGKKTLKEAAASVGISEQELKDRLTQVENDANGAATLNFDSWDLGFLADYIYNIHHKFVREQGPIIEQMAEKVANRHGIEHHELLKLAEGMRIFMADLYSHIQKEEDILFPMIKKIAAGEAVDHDEFKTTVNFIEAEHEHAGEELREFRALTKDYKLPANACNSYTYLFEKIKEFENDLFQHIHLENNVLFPKTLALQEN
jgi:regulator of cell morphogenesis and NO signaling